MYFRLIRFPKRHTGSKKRMIRFMKKHTGFKKIHIDTTPHRVKISTPLRAPAHRNRDLIQLSHDQTILHNQQESLSHMLILHNQQESLSLNLIFHNREESLSHKQMFHNQRGNKMQMKRSTNKGF